MINHAPTVLTSTSQANCSGCAALPRNTLSNTPITAATAAEASMEPVNSSIRVRIVLTG